MSFINMMEAKLPPGFRFHPRDDELICDYLAKKVTGCVGVGVGVGMFFGCSPLIDVDLNKCEPWDLPEMSCVSEKEWYFFSLRDRKYATGQRTNRATASGYWKATGKDRHVMRKGALVGMRKTLVFYQGRAPKGTKTDWVMHEFRMEIVGDESKYALREDWVLCRIFYKNGGGGGGLSSKHTMNTSNYEEAYINFGQPPMSTEGCEQVPCFSNAFSTGTPQPLTTTAPPRSMPDVGLSQLDCDKKMMGGLLNNLTRKKEPSITSLGEGNQFDTDLCNYGLSFVW